MKVIETEQLDLNPVSPEGLEDLIMSEEVESVKTARLYLQVYTDRVKGNSSGEVPEGYDETEIGNLWNQLKDAERTIKLQRGEFDSQKRTFMKHLQKLADRLEQKYDNGEIETMKDADPHFHEFCKKITKDLKIFLPRQVWEEYHFVKSQFSERFKRRVVGL